MYARKRKKTCYSSATEDDDDIASLLPTVEPWHIGGGVANNSLVPREAVQASTPTIVKRLSASL